ncbi:CidA/LrgA family protein [Pseudomonas matsuisoli]|uniref:CidA/LrgA family protein n=1 Tax=Pseudomonas matsuisoli TaxID=1515666 RepID=A0A917PXL8_9PSED|nr:CidA/LrgA family protein [Pseudomonas matsuisoli]GGJ97277.1 CidA/LrgA family protein [Pseudomonas matsuisoli]
MLLRGLTWLVVCQLLGTCINVLLLPMLPAPIIGLVGLFIFLLVRGEVGPQLSAAANGLLRYLPLLLVPPAVGVMAYGSAILTHFWALIASLVISLALSMIVCGVLMQRLLDRREQPREHS